MGTTKQKRYSLTIRLQPTEGSLLAEVVKWLNEMPIEEKTETISQLLVMACRPLVKADAGVSQEEREKSYWDFEQWVYHYKFILRKRLKLEGQFSWSDEPQTRTVIAEPYPRIKEDDDDDKVTSLKSHLLGKGSAKIAGSLFDGLG